MISVIMATKGRPEKLARCIDSISANCEILLYATCANDVPLVVAQDRRVRIFFDKDSSVVELYNRLAMFSAFDIVVASDDIVFGRGSIENAQACMDLFFTGGTGVVGFYCTNMQCNDDAFTMIGRRFYENDLGGILFNPQYKHFYADTELGLIAKGKDKFIQCRTAEIKNYHPASGEPADATHNHRRAEKLAHDRKVFEDKFK